MHLKTTLYLLCVALYSCQPKSNTTSRPSVDSPPRATYSKAVKDSLYVQTQLPLEYADSITKHYPVVVILDGNFHFPMLAASVRPSQYWTSGYSYSKSEVIELALLCEERTKTLCLAVGQN